ncbi:MAG: TolC family protein [Gemmatimonadaceae bacterium]|nr:TolC family protein [Gemmatimonadaceae bacterium]MCW5827256.1 TolC family protein [Gemmatimonadaceae bacterium]
MKVVATLLAAFTILPATLAAQDARPISLDEAVRLARRNAPAAVQARNAIRTNAAQVRSRYAAFLPNFSFGAGVSRQEGSRFVPDFNTVVSTDQPWRGSHRFNSNLELFDGGRRYFELQSARANVDAAEATEVSQSFNVALQVKQQYYGVLAAREQRAAAQKQLEQAEQQLRASTARVQAGAATRSDSLRTSIQVGNARLAILQAENNLATANAALSRLVGTTYIVTATPSDTAETGTIRDSDLELFAAAEQGPAVRQAQAQYAAARQSSRAAKTPYLPTLSMGMGWSYAAADSGFRFTGDSRNRNVQTSLNISFPIFNNLNREQQVVAAAVAEDNAEVQLRDARLNARQLMVQQLGAFRTAEARVEIQLASVAAGEEDLRVQQERYSLGASTLLDVLNSQTTLDQARRDLIQARLDARTAKAQIEALIGRDLQ